MDFRTTPEQAVDVLREFFTDSERFDYEKALGHGYFGVTARILDKKTNPPRKLAVKRALGKEAETELELEIKYLKVGCCIQVH